MSFPQGYSKTLLIISISLKQGIIPSEFKLGKITPIYKSDQKKIMNSYRSITVLPVYFKIFEKCVHKQVNHISRRTPSFIKLAVWIL